ncbi:hypothetical protein [Desulfosporosinus shakirovi]|uniref:hypothetical protein n=1 Tax=Desulfosporosinus shakirovi TaxID=2885154 RepID=UPI001E2948B3|nr:hypothetical protein [Desulfosporosinus sp. SRJS8]MCB8815005.1 hypothetical protein [Desulfosporosinus sp. SRJS8]
MMIKRDQSPNCCSDSCCHSHSSDSEKDCAHSHDPQTITNEEIDVLMDLAQCSYLPVSRFVMSSSKEEARFVSLAPVYINVFDDSMETVKEIGTVLSGLEKKRFISLDYDIPLEDYDYTLHSKSVLFAYFTETVNEGKKNPSFLCDIAEIELGSIALTELGEKVSGQIRREYDSANKAIKSLA